MGWVGEYSEQQKRVYEAQAHVSVGATFTSYATAQDFANALTSSDWWGQAYPFIIAIEVQDAPEGEPATGRYDESLRVAVVQIPRSMLNERVMLHEVAHAIAPEGSGHNARWVREFMALMSRALGSDRYLELFNAFKEHSVVMD